MSALPGDEDIRDKVGGGRKVLDLITVGRVSVDLYGQQIGSRLEDVFSFAKGVGGCPANIAIGAARLGLKAALISRVGDEPMGRFVREQLEREGVDTRGLATDPQRLTSLVLLSVRNEHTFPLIFYRDNCADSALCEADIEEEFIASSRALLVTGTHFSIPSAAQAQYRVIHLAKAHGGRVILDVDYRPNLWGIGGHGAGESRYARSEQVTRALAPVLTECDLIVGTEEELHIASGLEDTLAAVHHIRAHSSAVVVCKRGAVGCIVFAGGMPQSLEDGLVIPGMQVDVYNVLGAGDAFMAGFLRGWLRDEPHEVSARFANACGAIAVSRLLCSSEFPSFAELNHYLARGSQHRALREDAGLNRLHWDITRQRRSGALFVLALDLPQHSPALAAEPDGAPDRLARLKSLGVTAISRVAGKEQNCGVLLDASDLALPADTAGRKLWRARAVERPGSRPLEFTHPGSLGMHLLEWPSELTVSCRCVFDPEDSPEFRRMQEREMLRLAAACRAQRRELLLEIASGVPGEAHEDSATRVLSRLYDIGIQPDWWGLEPQRSSAAWQSCEQIVSAHDGVCRGMLVCVRNVPPDQRRQSVTRAANCPLVRGFVAGGSIVEDAARAWSAGELSEEATIVRIAECFRDLVQVWSSARDPRFDRAEGCAG